MQTGRRFWFGFLAVFMLIGACGEDDGGPTSRTLAVELTGLSPLGTDYVFEGWLIVDGAPVTTGRFDVVEGQSTYMFDVPVEVADAASTFVLTIEPAMGDDPAPASTHVLAGDFSMETASLSVGHPAALGSDFGSAEGSYILNTPSTAANDDDYTQGIWWLDPMAGPGATLDLPDLPDGWVYEGWVVGPDGPVTTGRFTAAAGEDSDGAGPTAGPDGFPPFPGQDYIDPGIVLTDFTAVLSVEPEPDNSSAPFDIKPLVDPTIADVGIGVLQDMNRDDAPALPSGMATFK